MTALVGYFAAVPKIEATALFVLMVGISLAAGCAAVLNQWIEQATDARMLRTRNRPLPSGQVRQKDALRYGLLLGVSGCLIVGTMGTPLALLLTLAILGIYLFIYTPLKQKTSWCTEVGAIPGALPPLIGWSLAEGRIGLLGWLLFSILIAWQMPHFMAIAWMCREDYAHAHLPMRSVVDPSGKQVAWIMLSYTLLLWMLSLLPWGLKEATVFYGCIALAMGGYLFRPVVWFWKDRERDLAARRVFFASLVYLPLLLIALVVDRWLFHSVC